MKLKTDALIAEEQIIDLMKAEISYPRSWQYLDGSIERLVLETTVSELSLYLDLDHYLRPGYHAVDDQLTVPTLFAKINYKSDNLVFKEHEQVISYDDETICDFLSDTNSEASLEGFKDKLSPIKIPYQNHLMTQLNLMFDGRNKYMKDQKNGSNETLVLSAISKINMDIFYKYNDGDLQFTSPKLIFDLSKRLLNTEESMALFYLNLIGCDVIIINRNGRADIENIIHQDHLNVYYGDHVAPKKEKPRSKLNKISYFVIFCVVLFALIFGIVAALPSDSEITTPEATIGETPVVETPEITETPVAVMSVDETQEAEVSDQVDELVVEPTPSEISSEMFTRFSANYKGVERVKTRINTFKENYILYDDESFYTESLRSVEFQSYSFNSSLSPGIYLCQAAEKGSESSVSMTKKVAVNGSVNPVNFKTSTNYFVDIVMFGKSKGNLKYKIGDDFGNYVIFHLLEPDGYVGQGLTIEATNKKTLEKTQMPLGYYGGNMELPDGEYTLSISDVLPQSNYDVKLNNEHVVVKNGSMYYDRIRNSPVEVISDDLVFECNLDDIYMIDLSKIFSDVDEDPLFYNVSLKDDYFDDYGGFDQDTYFNKITSDTDVSMLFTATDMYGDKVMKRVIIKVVENDLDEQSNTSE